MDVVKLFTYFVISRVILIAPLLTAGNLDNQPLHWEGQEFYNIV